MKKRAFLRFEDWEAKKLDDPEFSDMAKELEPGYQVTLLRIQQGLTQAQLADLVGTQQPSIARLENGTTKPSLTFLQKIADALNARMEVRLVSEGKAPYQAEPDDRPAREKDERESNPD